MLYIVHTQNGEILRCGYVPKEWASSQASGDERLLTDENISSIAIQQVIDQGNNNFYIDQHNVVSIPPCPQEDCIFDYNIKQWVVSPLLTEELRIAANSKVNETKLKVESAGFIVNGKLFDSSPISQLRINLAAFSATNNPEFSVDWTLADNSTITLDYLAIQDIAKTLWNYLANFHTQAKQFKQRIAQASSSLEIGAVLLDVSHWLSVTST